MPQETGEYDGADLTPLPRFGSRSETDVVLALLRSGGIPAVLGALSLLSMSRRILVPRNCVAEAVRLIAETRNAEADSLPAVNEPVEEAPSALTAVTWIFALGVAAAAILAIGSAIYRFAERLFR